jgi:predicted O-methyltransferase YrrM
MSVWRSIRKRLVAPLSAPPIVVVKSSSAATRIANATRNVPQLDQDTTAALDTVAAHVGQIGDPYPEPIYGTVADHFAASSSSRPRLALLAHLVKMVDAKSILEIGTAYGMSAIAMAKAQEKPALITVDGFEPQISISRRLFRATFPDGGVEQIAGDKSEVIARLVRDGRRFDFVLHDGGHDGDAYVRDFADMLPSLTRNSLLLIDDIDWDCTPEVRARTSHSRRTCYEGWREVAQHDRVEGAIEIRRKLGIVLVR